MSRPKRANVNSASSYRVRVYSNTCKSAIVVDTLVSRDSVYIAPGKLNHGQTYYWKVKDYKTGGEGPFSDPYSFSTINLIGIKTLSKEIPKENKLHNNYPNPFNPITTIKFEIAKISNVKLTIYDAIGKEITTLVNEKLNAGTYEVKWPAPTEDASNFASGVYFYKLITNDFIETKKMILSK